jgi:hypothetical protein
MDPLSGSKVNDKEEEAYEGQREHINRKSVGAGAVKGESG